MKRYMFLNTRLFSIQRYLFYLLILFLPTQFGKHFWPEFSYIQGIRSDYLSPTLYITDILICLMLVLWVFNWFKTLQWKYQSASWRTKIKYPFGFALGKRIIGYWKFVVLVVFLILGILLSSSPLAGVYGLIKLLEMIFFGFFVSSYLSKTKDIKKELIILCFIFSLSVLFESFLAIFQFIKQGSVGGMLYFFGERTFIGSTPGIANVSIGGELILRPYGTLPHPNVLAGFLVTSMTFVLFLYKEFEKNFLQKIVLITLSFGTLALIITFSRIPILLWIGVVLAQVFQNTFAKTSMKHLTLFLLSIIVLSGIFFSPLSQRFLGTRFDEESFVTRVDLMNASLQMMYDAPLFGVGLNNFLIRVPEYVRTSQTGVFQPVHNIYLLIAAQFGLIFFIIIIIFIMKTVSVVFRKIKKTKNLFDIAIFMSLILVLTIGFFDHYLLTLQQGQLLFSIFLGLSFVKMKHKKV